MRRSLSVLVAGLVGLALLATLPSSAETPQARPAGAPVAAAALAPSPGPAVAALQAHIGAALRVSRWPVLRTSFASVRNPVFPPGARLCGEVGPVPLTRCTFGSTSAPRTAVVVGDSIAVSYLEALKAVFARHRTWRLVTFASLGCTFTDRRTRTGTAAANAACPAEKDEAVRAVRALRPDLVLVTNRYGKRTDYLTGEFLSPGQWRTSQSAQARKLAPYAGTIAYLAPPPSDTDIRTCFARRGSTPSGCVSRVTREWSAFAAVDAAVAREVGGAFVDTRPLFCDPRGVCPSFVRGVPTKPDDVHITAAYGRVLAPALDEVLRRRGLL